MLTESFYTEQSVRVWDADNGGHVYVGPNDDERGCAVIRVVEHNGVESGRIELSPSFMLQVARAIVRLYDANGGSKL